MQLKDCRSASLADPDPNSKLVITTKQQRAGLCCDQPRLWVAFLGGFLRLYEVPSFELAEGRPLHARPSAVLEPAAVCADDRLLFFDDRTMEESNRFVAKSNVHWCAGAASVKELFFFCCFVFSV